LYCNCILQYYILGTIWWLSGEEPTCQCRRLRFDPWVEKMPWRRKWQPTSVFMPGKSHGQRRPAGYSSWGRKGIRHNLATNNWALHCSVCTRDTEILVKDQKQSQFKHNYEYFLSQDNIIHSFHQYFTMLYEPEYTRESLVSKIIILRSPGSD